MKIRNGFVSNSSTSSFAITTSLEHWEAIKKNLSAFQILVAEGIMSEPKNFCGMKIVTFTTWSTPSYSWIEDLQENKGIYPEDGDDDEDGVYYAWKEVEHMLKSDPDKISTNYVDMG